MAQIVTGFLWLFGLVWFIGLGAFSILSLYEGEKRAACISSALAVGGGLLVWLTSLLPAWLQLAIAGLLFSLVLLALLVFFLPVGRVDIVEGTPRGRFDERDVMFARSRLRPGSPEYQAYYAMRPENKAVDDRTRAKPGLFSPQAKFANLHHFSFAKGSFFLTDSLSEAVDGPVSEARTNLPAERLTRYLKDLAKYYGACQVGVTELKPYHVYTHIGRGAGEYGAPIPLEHRYALAFTVEMAFEMVAASPFPQLSMETAKQYVEAARVAVQLAAGMRELGFAARAHIDGNYRVIAPLVARDAGLGEIGRMGLLMTPNLGPRVRLGVVTTDAELVPDSRTPDPAVIDFCSICKKCAENCPSKSIPFGERREIDGVKRWKINSETCFHYWSVIGTDCGRCMAVCPYSHPDNLAHNLVRWGIARSGAFRRGALWLDDLFYGRHPSSKKGPVWTRVPGGEQE